MTKVTEVIEETKCRINHYGSRINGTCVNFHFEGNEHEVILHQFNMKYWQIEEALEELTPYELEESRVYPRPEADYVELLGMVATPKGHFKTVS